MDKTLQKLLEHTGFTGKEAQVYLALLELGEGDVSDISKLADLKRPIIYILLEGLIKRGYVSQLPDRKVNTFQAMDPTVVLNDLRTVSKHFAEMLPVFQSLRNKSGKRPFIQFLDNKKSIWKVFENMFFATEVFSITSYERIAELFPKAVLNWSESQKKGIYSVKGKHLIPDNKIEREIAKNVVSFAGHEVRTSKTIDEISMDFVLYDNKVAITYLADNPFMVLIESKEIYDSMKMLFDFAWGRGENLV